MKYFLFPLTTDKYFLFSVFNGKYFWCQALNIFLYKNIYQIFLISSEYLFCCRQFSVQPPLPDLSSAARHRGPHRHDTEHYKVHSENIS